MKNSVFLVSKFHKSHKGMSIYLSEDSSTAMWTGKKKKAKFFTDEQIANNMAMKHKGFVSVIPIL